MYRFTLITILIAFCSGYLYSQQPVTITGRVIDRETGKPLTGASVVIKSKEIIAVTDASGHFNLPLNEANRNESVSVSFLGYQSAGFTITEYIAGSDSLIRLTPNVTELREVNISADKLDLQKFLETTISLYARSMRQSPHVAKGHYREKARIDGRYVMFAESIGYCVYNGFDKPAGGYAFFCENTRKSDNADVWKDLAGNGTSGGKLSDVMSNSGSLFTLIIQCENYGPLGEKYWKTFTFHLDSTYTENNHKYYVIRFSKMEDSGSMVVSASTNQVRSVSYTSKALSGRPLNKTVKGESRIEFTWLNKTPFISSVSYHFKSGNLEYWNEYQMLIQKFGHFIYSSKDYYSMIWYAMVPFVDYYSQNWDLHDIKPDPDYPLISEQMRTGVKSLEEQYQANSRKWWLPDYEKMSMGQQGPVGFTKQVELAMSLIGKLRRLF